MSPRRRIQTDVPEMDDQGGLAQMNISLRPKVKTDGLAVLAFLLSDIHVCHLPWPYVSETDVTKGCP